MKRFLCVILMIVLVVSSVAVCNAETNHVESGCYLGFSLYETPNGLAVFEVDEDSPAQKVGILPGDVIVSANGEIVENLEQFDTVFSTLSPNDVLELVVYRIVSETVSSGDIAWEKMIFHVTVGSLQTLIVEPVCLNNLSPVSLFDENGQELSLIPENSSVVILGYDPHTQMVPVEYGDSVGYISSSLLRQAYPFDVLDLLTKANETSFPWLVVTSTPAPTATPKPTTAPTSTPTKCSNCSGGGKLTVSCNSCGGKGKKITTCSACNGRNWEKCSKCGGASYFSCNFCGGKTVTSCDSCRGRGTNSFDETCRSCRGTGTKKCSRCSGKGTIKCSLCNGYGGRDCRNCVGGKATGTCGSCGGKGKITQTCPHCNGTGQRK